MEPVKSMPAPKPIPFVVIVTEKNGVFVSSASSGYGEPSVSTFLINGVKPEPTHHSKWFRVPTVPTKVQKVIPQSSRVIGFQLKAGFAPSERMPATLEGEPYVGAAGHRTLTDTTWEGVSECYNSIQEPIPESLVDVPFALHVVAERENWQPVKVDFQLTHSLVDQILIHPDLLPERPCTLTVDQSFSIIANHINTHFDPKVAKVTYWDSLKCIEVHKVIAHEPVPYERTETTGRGRRTRTFKTIDYRSSRQLKVYETAGYHGSGPYSGHTLTKPFIGTSYEDLQANIKAYLDELMAMINEPLKECSACKGCGVVFGELSSILPKS